MSRWFFIQERCKLCGHKTTTQAATLYQVDSRSTMPCHNIHTPSTPLHWKVYPLLEVMRQAVQPTNNERNLTKLTLKTGFLLKTGIPGHFGAKNRYVLKPSTNHTPTALRLASLTSYLFLAWNGQVHLVLSTLSSFQLFLANFKRIRGRTWVPRHVFYDVSYIVMDWYTATHTRSLPILHV